MIVIRIKLKVASSNKDSLLNYLKAEVQRNKTLPGCLAYSLYQDVSGSDDMLLYEEWETIDAFNRYKNSASFGEIMATVAPLLTAAPDSVYFDSTIMAR